MSKLDIILFITACVSLTMTFVFYKKQNQKPQDIIYIDSTEKKSDGGKTI